MERENALNADAVGHLPDGERCILAAAAPSYHNALEGLRALLVAFPDDGMDTNRVAGTKIGYVFSQAFVSDFFDEIHKNSLVTLPFIPSHQGRENLSRAPLISGF
jgi:hypothetical protein